MGTGSIESQVLNWFGRMPMVPVPFFGRAISSTCADFESLRGLG